MTSALVVVLLEFVKKMLSIIFVFEVSLMDNNLQKAFLSNKYLKKSDYYPLEVYSSERV